MLQNEIKKTIRLSIPIVVGQLGQIANVIFHNQFLRRSPHIPQKSLGNFLVFHNPTAERGKIFQRFYRASNAIKTVPEGSGLGLALVKLLVEDWGGSVWFESSKDEGTVFVFTIPIGGMKEKSGEISLKV